jgi:hypothetical protein|nr:MAG TPA: hypothetical protein [Caudoviricetes sp.]
MNYELSDKLKSVIEEEIARLAHISDMSGEVALGEDFCFTPTQGMYAGFRVDIFSLSEEGAQIRVGKETFTYKDHLWRGGGWPTETSASLAFKCRETRRSGKIVEILKTGEEK